MATIKLERGLSDEQVYWQAFYILQCATLACTTVEGLDWLERIAARMASQVEDSLEKSAPRA